MVSRQSAFALACFLVVACQTTPSPNDVTALPPAEKDSVPGLFQLLGSPITPAGEALLAVGDAKMTKRGEVWSAPNGETPFYAAKYCKAKNCADTTAELSFMVLAPPGKAEVCAIVLRGPRLAAFDPNLDDPKYLERLGFKFVVTKANEEVAQSYFKFGKQLVTLEVRKQGGRALSLSSTEPPPGCPLTAGI